MRVNETGALTTVFSLYQNKKLYQIARNFIDLSKNEKIRYLEMFS